MPGWPDLHVLRSRLEREIVGRRITGVVVGDPVVIRSARAVEEMLFGRTFSGVRHHGKFIVFELDGVSVVVNPMLSGLFGLAAAGAKVTRDTRLRLALDDGRELRYRDDTRMGKVYLLEGEAPAAAPGFSDVGPDAVSIAEADFTARARRRGGEVRNLLQDQRVAAGIGNAYADEILWEARLHPKRTLRSLSPEELSGLHGAMRRVLLRAVEEVEAGTPPELGTKVRSHMRVRGRAGSPCPRCETPIRRTRKGDDETDYCPSCQPPPPGQLR
ncbi:DNA-formamidopyrimidine glycosylase [soil metagenome]